MNRRRKKFSRRIEEKWIVTTAFIILILKELSDSLTRFSLSNFKVAGVLFQSESVAVGRSGCIAQSARIVTVFLLVVDRDNESDRTLGMKLQGKKHVISAYINSYTARHNRNFPATIHRNYRRIRRVYMSAVVILVGYYRCHSEQNIFRLGCQVVLQPWKLVNLSRFEHAMAFINRH